MGIRGAASTQGAQSRPTAGRFGKGLLATFDFAGRSLVMAVGHIDPHATVDTGACSMQHAVHRRRMRAFDACGWAISSEIKGSLIDWSVPW
jgi:hypothetical protein